MASLGRLNATTVPPDPVYSLTTGTAGIGRAQWSFS